jgi:hypothetical protein
MKPAEGETIINDATEVKTRSRTADNEKAAQWVKGTNGVKSSQGTFADSAAFGEILCAARPKRGLLACLQHTLSRATRRKA